jgi:four helix bundle protein
MALSHERLDVYRLAIEFAGWTEPIIGSLKSGSAAQSQLERASTSIPLNIAEGNAKASRKDRARYWRIALGSTLECAAVLDVLVVRKIKTEKEVSEGKAYLERVAAMLIALLKNLGSKLSE